MNCYCVSVEFYESGRRLFCLISGTWKVKPKNQYRKVYGMSAFKIWFVNKDVACQLLEGIKTGETDLDDVLYLYNKFIEEAAA